MKYDIDLAYGIGFTVSGIDANSHEEAIKKARNIIAKDITILNGRDVDAGDLEFEGVNYISGNTITHENPPPKPQAPEPRIIKESIFAK
jgi:hypothetical protein